MNPHLRVSGRTQSWTIFFASLNSKPETESTNVVAPRPASEKSSVEFSQNRTIQIMADVMAVSQSFSSSIYYSDAITG